VILLLLVLEDFYSCRPPAVNLSPSQKNYSTRVSVLARLQNGIFAIQARRPAAFYVYIHVKYINKETYPITYPYQYIYILHAADMMPVCIEPQINSNI